MSEIDNRLEIGNDTVLVNINVKDLKKVGKGSTIIGADSNGNCILNEKNSIAIGAGASAGENSIAIGAGANAGCFNIASELEKLKDLLVKDYDQFNQDVFCKLDKLITISKENSINKLAINNDWKENVDVLANICTIVSICISAISSSVITIIKSINQHINFL